MNLAISYEGGAMGRALAAHADVIEVTPDTLCRPVGNRLFLDEAALQTLQELGASRPILLHGVGLSIGSADSWNDAYLELLEQCFDTLPRVLWHSEHLGFTRVGGRDLCTMLPVPYTAESLELIAKRVMRLRERFPVPFLLEPVVNLLPAPPGEMLEAEFLNELTAQTGCGVLLDAYNLVCDWRNHGRDVEGLLAHLDLSTVRELHVAGGVSVDGVQLDVHTAPPDADTMALARRICAIAPALEVVTFELLREGFEVLGEHGARGTLEMLRRDLVARDAS